MRDARTAEDLRAAQAVLLPLLGLTLDQTAAAVGKSRHWISRVRNQVMRGEAPPGRHGGRRTARLGEDEEMALVRDAIKSMSWGLQPTHLRTGVREALEKVQGHTIQNSTVTALLDRAAVHFLKDKRARASTLTRLATALGREFFSQDYIASHMRQLFDRNGGS